MELSDVQKSKKSFVVDSQETDADIQTDRPTQCNGNPPLNSRVGHFREKA